MPRTAHWKQIDRAGSVVATLQAWWEDNHRVYDADTCGDQRIEVVVEDGGTKSFYVIDHAWWITHDPEWEMHNEVIVTPVTGVTFAYPSRDRDWMRL